MPEEVVRPLRAHLAHRLDGEALVVDIDSPHRAVHRPEHVVVDHEALQAHPQQARQHARGFVDEVGPGMSGQHRRVSLLVAGLGVRQLGIRHPGRDAGREIVEPAHLRARRHQHRLLPAAPAHRPGAEIGDEGPRAEDRRMSGREGVDVDQSGQHLRHLLHHRAGQRGGAGRARLPRREQQDRHAASHPRLQAAAGILGEAQRRHHEAARHADEGTRPPARLVAGDPVQHRDGFVDVPGLHPARSDVLRGPGDRGVAGVEVEVAGIFHVAADDRPLEEVDVFEGVDQAGDVVEIRQGRFPVLAGPGIHDVHGGARGPEVHPVPGEFEVVAGGLPVEHDVAGGVRHRVLDQRAGEEEPAIGAQPPSGRGDRFDAARDGLGQPDPLQHVERGGVDPLDPVLVEGPVPAADHAGAHRLFLFAKRGRAQLAPRLPAAHAPSAHRGLAHGASCRRRAEQPSDRTR